ncbi:uncharacterized protein DEA37_0012706 [Paragonimus westermani]|uniref:Tetraspanin n=1 Tax=Paragonimus westermani TaxID=34504 RepID=A0A5J4NKB2_9TREM|nr:uncharacterized protein DEA37_0012706 [Paragonimus westermani]
MCRGITCILLAVVNTAVLVAGLALLIAGSLLRWNRSLFERVLSVALNKAGEIKNKELLDQALAKVQEMAGPIGMVLFIMGIVLICVAGLAFIGICCHIRLILIIYAVVIGIIIAAHVILLIVYFSDRRVIFKYIDQGLQIYVKKYKSLESQEVDSAVVGIFMPAFTTKISSLILCNFQFQCCGYFNGSDFLESGAEFTRRDSVQGQEITNLSYPLPCCKPESTGPNDNQCPKKFDNDTSYYSIGCKQRIDEKLVPLMDRAMKWSVVVLVFEVAVLALTIIHLCCSK